MSVYKICGLSASRSIAKVKNARYIQRYSNQSRDRIYLAVLNLAIDRLPPRPQKCTLSLFRQHIHTNHIASIQLYTIHALCYIIYLSFLYDIVQPVVGINVKLFKQGGVLVENRLIVYLYMFIYGIPQCIT